MFRFPVLIGDIGGTNARFAVLPEPGGPFHLLPRALTAASPDPLDAIRIALQAYEGPAPRSAMIAVANRVDGTVVTLTNAAWTIDAGAIGRGLGLERVTLVNDYPPVAASAVALRMEEGHLAPIGTPRLGGSGTRVVLGPGTGFGAAALVPVGERLVILATEAGHAELGPANPDEHALWPHLEPVLGRITVEAVLSGPGLLRLAQALGASRGAAVPYTVPNDVLAAAQAGDPLGTQTVRLFARLLGRLAGDLALIFEASGGVLIAGGVAPRMVDVIQSGAFRDAFDGKTPHEDWSRAVPAAVIVHPEPALLGLSALVSDPDHFIFPSQSWLAG